MTPHEHYLEAERLLADDSSRTPEGRRLTIAAAHVHALLASTPRPPRYRSSAINPLESGYGSPYPSED